jgi:uncharacterized protein (DUF849 family)
MHEKVMLTCAVTGNLTTLEQHRGLPVTPKSLGASPASPREARQMLGLDR